LLSVLLQEDARIRLLDEAAPGIETDRRQALLEMLRLMALDMDKTR
jgi:hypothetical protein